MRHWIPILVCLTFRLFAAENAESEWTVELGCQHCQFSELTGIKTCKGNCGPAARIGDKVYTLQGAAVPKDFKKGGEWKIKGTLSADGKSIAVKEMNMTALPPTKTEEGEAVSKAQSWTGSLEKTGAGLPTLVVDKTKYGLKASKTAPKSVSVVLTKIGGGELKGTLTAYGTTYEDDTRKWIVVDAIKFAN